MVKEPWPSVSIITPVLNVAKIIEQFFRYLDVQEYPGQIEIIMPDGGSTDDTRQILSKRGIRIIDNPLKTGEAGKAVGLREAKGDIVVLLDSDNFPPDKHWLKEIIRPLKENPDIIGSEPLYFTWRKKDHPVTRYFALIGMGDPIAYFTGNYDRFSYLSNAWTGMAVQFEDKKHWLELTLKPGALPTIGANGTAFRRSFLAPYKKRDYLFDIDILAEAIKEKPVKFAKVKNGIVHLYSTSMSNFARKQRRRINDFIFHQSKGNRAYTWENRSGGQIKFILSCLLIAPLLWQMARGFVRKPDWAWIYHLPACYITLWVYGTGTIRGIFHKAEESRAGWKQG